MYKEILKELGFTEGEIKIYEAVIKLKKASTGPIVEESGVSSSKVYPILDKLVKKGLVSFILENNVKKFQATNPESIIDYIQKKENKIKELKEKSEEIVDKMKNHLVQLQQETAQVYIGLKGILSAHLNILDELEEKEEYLFFSVSGQELTKKVESFFMNFHSKRIEKKIGARGIVDKKYKTNFKEMKKLKKYSLRFAEVNLPSAIAIGKNRIILSMWEENPIAFEIVSERTAKRFKEFFEKMWKRAKD